MKDDKGGRRLQEEIEKTDQELRKLDDKAEEREGRKLAVEEDLQTKSRILKRKLMEPAQASGAAPGKKSEEKPLRAESPETLLKEAVLRHQNSRLEERRGRRAQMTTDARARMRITLGVESAINESMERDLRGLEETSDGRLKRIRELSARRAGGGGSAQESAELRRLEDNEADRYYLRERLLSRIRLEELGEYGWVRPIGDGMLGIKPYTVLTQYDRLSPSNKRGVRWQSDSLMMRFQNAIVGHYAPKKASFSWLHEKTLKGFETQFDDINEEIYSDKKWAETVRKGQARLEDMEEELRGYDNFTVEEERKIKKLFSDYMKKQVELGKEIEYNP